MPRNLHAPIHRFWRLARFCTRRTFIVGACGLRVHVAFSARRQQSVVLRFAPDCPWRGALRRRGAARDLRLRALPAARPGRAGAAGGAAAEACSGRTKTSKMKLDIDVQTTPNRSRTSKMELDIDAFVDDEICWCFQTQGGSSVSSRGTGGSVLVVYFALLFLTSRCVAFLPTRYSLSPHSRQIPPRRTC